MQILTTYQQKSVLDKKEFLFHIGELCNQRQDACDEIDKLLKKYPTPFERVKGNNRIINIREKVLTEESREGKEL